MNLRLRYRRIERNGSVLIAWPTLKNPKVVETGYCYGQAGIILPLLRLAEVLPRTISLRGPFLKAEVTSSRCFIRSRSKRFQFDPRFNFYIRVGK